MIRKILYLFFLVLLIIPMNISALSEDYNDTIYKVTGEKIEENKVNLYLFYGEGCPHCTNEEVFLDSLKEKYGDKINIYQYETWNNKENKEIMLSVKALYNLSGPGVPFTVIGDKYYSGYNDFVGEKIEQQLRVYLELDPESSIIDDNKENIPLLGEINKKDVSVGLVAIVLGFVDGFNPCAMWVLLFLINMLFGMQNKKKMMLIGFTFLFTSAMVYFVAMLGITTIVDTISTPILQLLIGVVAVILGGFSLKKFITTKDDGCTVVDDKKRKKIFRRIDKIIKENNIVWALFGIILLAVTVNTVELACSLGFPTMFSEILAVNDITGVSRIIYLLIYTLFYMIDDLIIFIIAVSTLSIAASSSKFNKYSSLIGGILMVLMGILLIFKPEWIMFNL